ncbi:MAG: ATP12 family chaperone protein [Pseudomonadota bacterium]
MQTQTAPKRFWTEAAAVPVEDGWTVRLDSRPVRTPAGRPFTAPTQALAEAAAAEWDAQEARLDPRAMPLTRTVNTVIDRVIPQQAEVAAVIAAYGGSDLLCYRAPHPEALIRRQAEAWDPLLDWAERRYAAPLHRVEGVMHVAQPEESLAALTAAIEAHDAFALAALHDLVTLSGSLVIGLAVSEAELDPEEGWRRSRIDEDYQAELWGVDAEAAAQAEAKRQDFLAARRLLDLLA